MIKKGPQFYDELNVFRHYMDRRSCSDSPNDTIEQPIIWELIGNPAGLRVLDLGCGDARIAARFRQLGARRYVGIEGSERMIGLAKAHMVPGYSEIHRLWLEDFKPVRGEFDLAVSSLALHYVDAIGDLFAKVHDSLRPGGRLVFSVEHPVITSSNESVLNSPVRGAWIVDQYFERGRREVSWMGDEVVKYHRTVEDYLNLLVDSGFRLERMRESDPPAEKFQDRELLKRRRRIPLFLFVAAQRG
jgi:SAM-dependent methyltransferase